MTPCLIQSATQITPAWLDSVLNRTATPSAPRPGVASCEVKRIGTGQMADTFRVDLSYHDGEAANPRAIIVKLAAADAVSRQTACALGVYEIEVGFYLDIAPHTEMAVPHCLYASMDGDQGHFTLVLEDLGEVYRAGDVLSGGSVTHAAQALEALAQLQAPFWNDARLARHRWLDPARATQLFSVIPPATAPFLERFAHLLDPAHARLIELAMPRALQWHRGWQAPSTLTHGDFRLDNMMLATTPQSRPLITLDWQTLKLGPPTLDVGYYLAACLPIAERRTHQRELLAQYLAALANRGVAWSAEALWEDYRRSSLYGLLLCAFATKVQQTERGDRMFAAAAGQYAELALELDALSLLQA